MVYKRYIEAVGLAEVIENLDIRVAGKPARWNDAKYSVLREISQAPDADVVEVVRCKDCIFRYTPTCSARHERADMDYCSGGRRKT